GSYLAPRGRLRAHVLQNKAVGLHARLKTARQVYVLAPTPLGRNLSGQGQCKAAHQSQACYDHFLSHTCSPYRRLDVTGSTTHRCVPMDIPVVHLEIQATWVPFTVAKGGFGLVNVASFWFRFT